LFDAALAVVDVESAREHRATIHGIGAVLNRLAGSLMLAGRDEQPTDSKRAGESREGDQELHSTTLSFWPQVEFDPAPEPSAQLRPLQPARDS
jgi:hypothetical protein